MVQKKEIQKKAVEMLNTHRAVKWLWIVVAAPFAILLVMLGLIAVGAFGKLPTFEELENPKTNLATEIYSEDGKIIGQFFVESRSDVSYRELNDSLVAALVSTEDMRFYNHSGIDFIALARVGLGVLTFSHQGGGSTLTQQLAKNLFKIRESVGEDVGRSNILVFKLKEWITALRLEYNYTKEEIITMYLNTVEYSRNAVGIKSASQSFFNKLPHELTINEAALLVGMVNAPTAYDPVRNPERSLRRRNTVLDRMKSCDFITRAERDSLKQLPIELDYHPITHTQGTGTYFRERLRAVMNMKRPTRSQFQNDWDFEQELRRWDTNPIYGWCIKNKKADGTNYNVYTDGLKIYTTLNSSMQKYAEEALYNRLANEIQPAYDRQFKRDKVQFIGQDKGQIEKIINNAMRYSDRYMGMKKAGASSEEINKAFKTPVKMSLFTYKGQVDTLMTPRDSILYYKRIMRASFMAMDPTTGYVKAYVGGPDYRYFQYDMVAQGKRQVGSTIKPFVYTFAIDHLGYTPCTPVANVPVSIATPTGEAWQPKEASSKDESELYDGQVRPLSWGLENSRNNYTAWIMKQGMQPQAVADFIHRMGVHSYIDPVYALALGTMDVSLFEMVGAYSTFVNSGVFTEPIFVTRIEDRYGNLIATFTPVSYDAISEQTAYTMLGMLQNVINRGTGGRLRRGYGFTGQIGGKTGTSQESRDAWFMGVTPKLVGGAWVGGEDQSVHLRSAAEGSTLALPIFGEFMKRVYANPSLGITQEDKFFVPQGAITYNCESEINSSSSTQTSDEFFQ